MKRRSSSNPPDRSDSHRRTTQLQKYRGSSDGSHIPRPRIRSLSTDRLSGRKSNLIKQSGKVSIGHYGLATPSRASYAPRSAMLSMSVQRNTRSPSAERAGMLVGKAPRKDTRPIADKAFQTLMIKKIENYFHNIQQSSMLNTNGSLKPLSIKMFVDMSGLLVGLLGIKHTLNTINYVEEIPKIAKKLNYMGQMTKAWLKTANAMHGLPNSLAWLSWLVELCELKDLAFEQFSLKNLPFLNVNDQAAKNRNLFLSMMDWYIAWNEDAQLEETLVEEYLQDEESHYDVSDETYQRAKADYENKLREFEKEELRIQLDIETKKLNDILTNLKQDNNNIDDYFLEQNQHIKNLDDENEKVERDCNILDDDIEKNLQLQEKLKLTIDQQKITIEERDEIVAKCNDIKKFLKEYSNHVDDIQKDVYSRDIKLASLNHNLTKIVLKYNRDCHNSFVGITGVDITKIELPENISSTLSIDILKNVSKELTILKTKKEKELHDVEKLIVENNVELQNLEKKLSKVMESEEDMGRKSEEIEIEINEIVAQGKLEEADIREKNKKLEEKIKLIQESRVDLVKLNNELEEGIDKLNSLKRRKEYLEQNACIFFENFYSILAGLRKEREQFLIKD
ncbi:kinetochore protein NDC80 homolog [Leptopilina boulardi]|uniref:kinetochore protein NDC80 homolog n=1 Tax=Leptopilina boulardi TaxID=63433 RepID=UPI0021F5F9E6|nr:kinetochore protein NDC80 homolog [Leptopilina boulardi]